VSITNQMQILFAQTRYILRPCVSSPHRALVTEQVIEHAQEI